MLREKATQMTKEKYQEGGKILDWNPEEGIEKGFKKDLRFPSNFKENHCWYLIFSAVACSAHCESDEERRLRCDHKLNLAKWHCPPSWIEKYKDKLDSGEFSLAEIVNSDIYLDFDSAPMGYVKFPRS
ncbi:MAG: Cytochrome c oxidase subunit 6B1 [Paramarteilia canceri]